MKLRYLFASLLAALALVACQDELTGPLDEVQVSQSYVGIPANGGQTTVTVNATGSWNFSDVPEWLTISPAQGSAGETAVTFSAQKAEATREATVLLNCGNGQQHINVIQMTQKVELPITLTKDITEEGKIYRAQGTVANISNTQYGNWDLVDESGSIYVYGTLDAQGATKNFLSLGLEAGDKVIVEGPYKLYNGTRELVDVTVIDIEKSLVKVEAEADTIAIEGGVAAVELTAKGALKVAIPDDSKSWISISGVSVDGNKAVVSFDVAANAGGNRTANVKFTVGESTVESPIFQLGSIVEISVADFLSKEVGTALFKLSGKVANLQTGDYGNFDLVDATGSVYVYGLTATPQTKNDKSFPTLGIKEGDWVTLVGTRADYKGTAQVGGPAYYISHKGHTEATVADFLAKETGDAYYKLTGTISNLQAGDYGNFDLTDETGTVYVYGLTVAPVAKNDKSFPKLGLKDGDKITLVGTRAEYKGTAQVGGPAYFIEKLEGTTPEEPETPGALTVKADVMPSEYVKDAEGNYAESKVKVGDVEFAVLTVANYGDGIQIRKEGGYIKNVTSLKNIKSIKLTFNPDKSFYPSNLEMTSGETTITPAVDETAKTATYDFSKGTYADFKLANTSGYAVYLSSIEISYGE